MAANSRRPHTRTAGHTRTTLSAKSARRRKQWLTMLLLTVVGAILFTIIFQAIENYHNKLNAQLSQQDLERRYNFNPGNIISDANFFNTKAMSREEVNAFITNKGAQCTGGSCLKSQHFDTTTIPADDLCDTYHGAHGESAGDIIDKTAHACGISQRVLLTMLQKEQHLITDRNPQAFQYHSAMGLSCPDDDHCDPRYKGFFKQVFGGAKRYRYYLSHLDEYQYKPYALNTIQYHPNPACSSKNIYIENNATALLYIYTPYQPNVASLEAGFGEGNSCSSYGNRNFSLIYRQWFGNPRE